MKKDNKSTAEILRQKAEALVKKRPSRTASQLSETETLKLIHELEVHQIELEMQNEELVQARSAIQETAEKYTELYDFAPSGYITLSKKGEIIDLNFCGSQMLGKERSRLIKSQFGFFVSNDTRPIFNLFKEKVFINKSKESCEVTLLSNGDLPIYILLSGIVDENGEHCHITAIDITERKLAENKMQFLTLRQEAILASVPEIIAEVDNNKVYTWLNKTGIEFFGEDVIGKEASFYFVDEQKTYNTVEPLFRGDEDIIYLGSWQRRKDGENRLLGWWCKSLKDENGIPRGALSTARDITEYKLLQEKEQEYLTELRTLSDTASNLIKVKDSNDVFTELTEKLAVLDPDFYITISVVDKDNMVSLRKIIGIESKFAVISRKMGVNPYDIKIPVSDYTDHEIIMFKSNAFCEYKEGLYGLSAKKIPKAIANGLEKMLGINQIYIIGITTGDEIFGLVTLLRKNKGEFKTRRIIETIVNQASVVLKRQHVEEEILQINAELEHRITERTSSLEDAMKELEAFSYSVSHDLRAPLRHINGYVDLLCDCFHDSLPEKGKHYLDSISDSAHQMGALIDDLLQFSKTSRLDMQQVKVDMNDVLQEAMKIVKQDTTGRRIEWITDRLPDVLGDHNLLLLVWINLLSNAVKFTGPKKKARIETGFRKEDAEYVFFVRDNGVGFDMQYAQKLFGVFQRLHSSSEFKGTGIGLANVRRIIHKHGGRTWAEAKLNEGATFYFTIPKTKEKKHE